MNNDIFEVNFNLLSSFDFSFFNYINNDQDMILILNQAIKLYIYSFQKIDEWRIRYNLYIKFKDFFSEKENILKISKLNMMWYNLKDLGDIILQLINNIRVLLHLFFLDKANIIRMSCLDLINTIVNFQIEIKLTKNFQLIRISEELMKYQLSIFCKNSIYDEKIINNLELLDMNKSYSMKLFFLESVKKFINLYSNSEKNIIKRILELIENNLNYSKENIANNKIKSEIDYISDKLQDIKSN